MSEKNNRDRGSRRGTSYKRDTILMICALAVLFLAPVGISIYSNYQEQQLMEEYAAMIEESLASSSEATPPQRQRRVGRLPQMRLKLLRRRRIPLVEKRLCL